MPSREGEAGMAEFPIVGIGSSAGGLEALQKLFGAMPPDSGVAFIVAAHLDRAGKPFDRAAQPLHEDAGRADRAVLGRRAVWPLS